MDLIYRIGQAFADECKSKSASVLLAPTLNVVRSPLGGRNYETYGEDPFLLGKLGAACVNGEETACTIPKDTGHNLTRYFI